MQRRVLMLARKLLARHKGGTQADHHDHRRRADRVLGGRRRPLFSYPPTPRTLQQTLLEVGAARARASRINTFMLERSYGLMRFVDEITRINRGRAFFADPERLGEYILVDYVRSRKRFVA